LDAVNNAKQGHLIVLAKYSEPHKVSNESRTTFEIKGNPTNLIIVKAEEVGKVILDGSAGYRFKNCEYLTWNGFTHTHESISEDDREKHDIEAANIAFEGGKNNRFARCEVSLKDKDGQAKLHWLRISGCETMKVDYCFFHDKNSKGNFCNVKYDRDNEDGTGPLFEYNYFLHQDYNEIVGDEDICDAGGETIQMGDSICAVGALGR
jgi:hypothetical protein